MMMPTTGLSSLMRNSLGRQAARRRKARDYRGGTLVGKARCRSRQAMMSGRSWSSMRAISSLRASFFFLRRLSWRASARPDSSKALMALSRSRCSCLSLSSVARSSRISSLSIGRPLLLASLRDGPKYRGEPAAAQGLGAICQEVKRSDWRAEGDKSLPICHNGRNETNAWRSDMALDARLEELSEKHRALDRKIEEELARPTSDDLKIAEWKRQKLRLKDEMERLKHQLIH